jgi:hypothetical protein
MDEKSRRIDLEVLTIHSEGSAVRTHADAIPFPALARIGSTLRDAVHVGLSPPAWHLGWIGKRLEDSLGWRGHEDFGFDGVVVGSDGDGCHKVILSISRQIS